MERFKSITIILLLAFAVPASAVQTKPASVLLQEGLYAEEIEGNLEAAIKVYERILKEFPKNRPVDAKALLHIGLSYEKLGRSEARKAYERVLREYADQPEAVSAARVRLTTLGQQEGGQGPIVRRVWADAADSYLQGAPSPDGRYLSCVWDGDLAIRDLATGQNRRLTNEGLVGKGWASNSVFSPDGKQLAYTWWNDEKGDDELRVVGVDGSEPRVIHHRSLEEKTSLHRPAGWSPDGKHILALGAKDGSPQILLVPPEDGPVRVLTTLPKKSHPFWIHYGGGFSANLSPNGQFVAYTFFPRDDSGTRDIWAVAVDGSGETPLVEDPADDIVLGWAPDGKCVVFASDRTGSMGIWTIQVAEGKPQGAPKLLKAEIGQFYPLGMARNGSLYYGVFSGGNNIYVAPFNPQNGNVSGQPAVAIQRHWGSNWAPAFSPDGSYLACVSSGPAVRNDGYFNAPYSFLIRSIETGEVRELSLELKKFDVRSLCWSPDGRSLLGIGITDTEPGHDARMYGYGTALKIDIETGDITIPIERGSSPKWAPDGKTIFDIRRGSRGWGILRHDLTARSKWEANVSPGWSRTILNRLDKNKDGELTDDELAEAEVPERIIATQLKLDKNKDGKLTKEELSDVSERFREGLDANGDGVATRNELETYASRYAGRTWMFRAVGAISGLAVSPDGKQLAFADHEAGMLKVMSVNGGQPQELAKVEGQTSITWTPDGTHLVYTNVWGPGPAWRIPAEGGEPQKLDLDMYAVDHISFHPNGRQIAFRGKREPDKREVWVLENFLPESK